jgi:hypothetical protein
MTNPMFAVQAVAEISVTHVDPDLSDEEEE